MQLEFSNYVYFAYSPATDTVKVGVSGNPYVRIRDLRKDHDPGLYLTGAIPCSSLDQEFERNLHAEFTAVGAHVRGEWFKYQLIAQRMEQLLAAVRFRFPRILSKQEILAKAILRYSADERERNVAARLLKIMENGETDPERAQELALQQG